MTDCKRERYIATRILFYIKETEPAFIECGDNLGDRTNEMKSEFVSRGPKNYDYSIVNRDWKSKTVCKVSGKKLNYTDSQLVNFDVTRDMIMNENSRGEMVTGNTGKRIKRKNCH